LNEKMFKNGVNIKNGIDEEIICQFSKYGEVLIGNLTF